MLNPGLNRADLDAFEAGLLSDHKVRIRADLTDLDHRIVGTCTGHVVGGQVDWDRTQDTVRTCSLQVHNPGDVLNLGTNNAPMSAAYYADRMLSVHYEVWSQQLPRWVSVPVFIGPIQKVESGDNDTITITAADKQKFLAAAPYQPKLYRKGTRFSDAVVDIARNMGERFIDVPTYPAKSTKDYQMSTKLSAWRFMQSFAGALGGTRMEYDARGYLRLRAASGPQVFRFRKGTGGSLLSEPKLTFTAGDLVNCVTVTGSTPAGSKGIPSATVYAPADHPLNGANIGRGGVPRWIKLEVQDDAITSGAAALARAQQELSAAMRVAADVELDALCIPHLEPGDTVRVDAETWSWSFTIDKASIPLDGSGHMTIGRHYATRQQLRPKVMPRKGRGVRSVVHNTVKTPVKKADPKKTQTKRKATTVHHSTSRKK